MNELTPSIEKIQVNLDKLDDTVKAINLARTAENRIQEVEEERKRRVNKEKREPSMQEILAGIMSDMGDRGNQVEEYNKSKENEGIDR